MTTDAQQLATIRRSVEHTQTLIQTARRALDNAQKSQEELWRLVDAYATREQVRREMAK